MINDASDQQVVLKPDETARDLPEWARHVPSEPLTSRPVNCSHPATVTESWSHRWWQFRSHWRQRNRRLYARYGLSIRDVLPLALLVVLDWLSVRAIGQISDDGTAATFGAGVFMGVWAGVFGIMTLHGLALMALTVLSACERRVHALEAGHGA